MDTSGSLTGSPTMATTLPASLRPHLAARLTVVAAQPRASAAEAKSA